MSDKLMEHWKQQAAETPTAPEQDYPVNGEPGDDIDIEDRTVRCQWADFDRDDQEPCNSNPAYVGYCDGEMIFLCVEHYEDFKWKNRLDLSALFKIEPVENTYGATEEPPIVRNLRSMHDEATAEVARLEAVECGLRAENCDLQKWKDDYADLAKEATARWVINEQFEDEINALRATLVAARKTVGEWRAGAGRACDAQDDKEFGYHYSEGQLDAYAKVLALLGEVQ